MAAALKLLGVGYLGDQAAQQFGRGDSAAVSTAAGWLGVANVLEVHKAPLAAGDGLVLGNDYAGARTRFEEALSVSTPLDECKIRVNLALSSELLGDARRKDEDPAAAGRLFAEARAVVDTAPDGCFAAEQQTGTGQNQDGEGERLQETAERLRAKAAEAGHGKPQTPGQPDGNSPAPAMVP
ncbi:hypothetical protein [Pseudarthrobacter sp. N5]|uniref:hypothetical protein n=1 Tax=Pseudarthrobacter sp. N5 TaxID=3418416 RepID=UPI003CF94ADB